MSENQGIWKNERFFSSYEEANSLRNSLRLRDVSGTLQVKVKRCGTAGTLYVVKSRVVENVTQQKKPTKTKKNKETKVTHE